MLADTIVGDVVVAVVVTLVIEALSLLCGS